VGGADALTVLDANRGRRKKASSIMLDSFVLNRGISHNLTQPSEKNDDTSPAKSSTAMACKVSANIA
jgi:hypothetical protein